MPIYEYRCRDCGHYVDVLQKLNDDPLRTCPACETESLKRLVSAPAFRLKGGGWYETDFKSDKEKRRNLAEGAKEPDQSGGGESKSAESGAKGDGASKSSDGASSAGGGSDKSSDKPAKPKTGGAESKAAV